MMLYCLFLVFVGYSSLGAEALSVPACDPTHPNIGCLLNPCLFATCRYPGAVCHPNYCRCKATFIVGGDVVLTKEQCRHSGGGGGGGGGSLKRCKASAMRLSSSSACYDECTGNGAYDCPTGQQCCFNGYCKKCEAIEYPPVCDPYVPNSKCLVDPCQYKTCYYPGAVCQADYCTCEATFLVGDVALTPEQCEYNGGGGGGGGLKKCKASAFRSVSASPCRDECSGTGYDCGHGEECCFNGYCKKCEAKEVEPPRLKHCEAYNPSGHYCSDKCTAGGGCGFLEECCYNGRCNKCELKSGVGPGLEQCVNSHPSSAYLGCYDQCTLSSDCYGGKTCCFNGFCKMCEQRFVIY